jgi:hypothetical protein
MTTCSTCANWAPKRTTPEQMAMAKQGLFLCALRPRWEFHSAHLTCDRHKPAAEDVLEKRLKWLASPTAKRAASG